MQNGTPTWDDLRYLLEVHRGKSLLAAGRALGVATSTVARRLEGLERTLGRPLVHRGNGGTSVDADALGLLALAEQMELGLHALRRGPSADRIAGTVRISAGEGFVRPLVRMLAELRIKHPALQLEIAAESRLADLPRREADIGIRTARTASPTLIEKPIGKFHLALFAARSYVERRLPGASLSRSAAAHHDWIGFDRALEKLASEQWMRAYGAERFVLRSSSYPALEEAVLAGMGLGVLSAAQGAALSLVRIETESAPPPVPVYLAFHRDARDTPRVRAVVREIEAALRRAAE